MLELRDVRKSYGKVTVTDGLSLTIESNELRAIIGPNGAGKTSLIAQISGELSSDSGEFLFNGRSLNGMSMPARRQLGISRTFQITSLLPNFSALDNVRLAVQALDGRKRSAFASARRDTLSNSVAAGLLDFVGLAERAGTIVNHLAHGEQRQLEIAVALAGSPPILLLDEPTAGMGSDDAIRVKNLIASIKGSRTILLIEHDMPTVFALADRVTVLVNGREIATGSPEQVRRNEQVRASYLGDEDA
jgi:branched-chain amino acid transport system ATP-binding protein